MRWTPPSPGGSSSRRAPFRGGRRAVRPSTRRESERLASVGKKRRGGVGRPSGSAGNPRATASAWDTTVGVRRAMAVTRPTVTGARVSCARGAVGQRTMAVTRPTVTGGHRRLRAQWVGQGGGHRGDAAGRGDQLAQAQSTCGCSRPVKGCRSGGRPEVRFDMGPRGSLIWATVSTTRRLGTPSIGFLTNIAAGAVPIRALGTDIGVRFRIARALLDDPRPTVDGRRQCRATHLRPAPLAAGPRQCSPPSPTSEPQITSPQRPPCASLAQTDVTKRRLDASGGSRSVEGRLRRWERGPEVPWGESPKMRPQSLAKSGPKSAKLGPNLACSWPFFGGSSPMLGYSWSNSGQAWPAFNPTLLRPAPLFEGKPEIEVPSRLRGGLEMSKCACPRTESPDEAKAFRALGL